MWIKLTTKGRKLIRQALAIASPARLLAGTLREWHWRALCWAYVRGDEGIPYDRDTGEFGYVSWNSILRLRDYKQHGEVTPIVKEKKFAEEHTETVGGVTFKRDYIKRLCITDFGRHYYRENWQRYRALYPTVNAPAP